MSQEETENVEFVPLLNFENDYEILNIHPFTIRKKLNHRILKECNNGNGYISVSLNEKTYLKHRIIALQFIPYDNPSRKTEVDHITKPVMIIELRICVGVHMQRIH